ncbi:MAG: protease modulator HflC [Gammaproteobacteria bacterium]|nr:protease modulator HflC [Gammaproteobacteria bacterium]
MSTRSTVAVAAVAGLVVAANALFITPPAQHDLVLRFGQIAAEYDRPGLHLKLPFVGDVRRFDARLLPLDDQALNVTTRDGRQLQVSYYGKWRIGDLPTYYRATGGQEIQALDRLSTLVGRAVANAFGAVDYDQAAVRPLPSLLAAVDAGTRKQIGALGVELVDLRVRDLEVPKDLIQATYERMRSERKRNASDLRAQGQQLADQLRTTADSQAAQMLADAHRQAEQVRGQGDAEAMKIYAKAYGQDPEFFRFYRSLQAYQAAFGDGHGVLVLRPDSEFFRYFHDAGKH